MSRPSPVGMPAAIGEQRPPAPPLPRCVSAAAPPLAPHPAPPLAPHPAPPPPARGARPSPCSPRRQLSPKLHSIKYWRCSSLGCPPRAAPRAGQDDSLMECSWQQALLQRRPPPGRRCRRPLQPCRTPHTFVGKLLLPLRSALAQGRGRRAAQVWPAYLAAGTRRLSPIAHHLVHHHLCLLRRMSEPTDAHRSKKLTYRPRASPLPVSMRPATLPPDPRSG